MGSRGEVISGPFVTTTEAAEQMRVTRQWVYQLIKRRRLRSTRGEGARSQILIPQSEVDRYLSQNMTQTAEGQLAQALG